MNHINAYRFNDMKICAAALIVIILQLACKSKEEEEEKTFYRSYDKWKTDDRTGRELSGAPKEVKEISYNTLVDTSLQPPPKFNDFRIYRFDTAGHLNYIYTFLDSSFTNEMHFTNKGEGVRARILSFDKIGGDPFMTTISTSKKISNNQYHVIATTGEEKAYEKIETYERGGDLLTIEFRQHEKSVWTVTNEYNKDKLVFSKKTESGVIEESAYYYSSNGFIDSTAISIAGLRKPTRVYNNNEHGDPVQITEGKQVIRFAYEYDSKGNWIKRLEYNSEPGKSERVGSKFPNYSLLVREIKY